MGWKQTIKYLCETNQMPKNWKDALRLWKIKKQHPNKTVILRDGKYYYEGVLLQMRDDHDVNTFFYKKIFWEIEE